MRSHAKSTPAPGAGDKCRAPCSLPDFRWGILTVCALWAWWRPCRASETPTPSTSRPTAASTFLDQGSVIADLDGDTYPDLAVVRPEGWAQRGFRYRIELDLTTHLASSFLSLAGEQGGLHLVTRDVDGD